MVKLIHDLLGLVDLVFTLVFMRDVICLFLFLEHKRRFHSWTVILIKFSAREGYKTLSKILHRFMKFILLKLKEKKKQRANRVKISSANTEETKHSKFRDLPDYLRVIK